MTAVETTTKWYLKGRGYEFCNCAPGCSCNFSGFPSSNDGSCKAFVGNIIDDGRCGDVDLSGIKAIAVLDWPKAIHDGGGKAVFIVEPDITDEQLNCLAQIYTGALGGNPWAILGGTYEVAGVVKTPITIKGSGLSIEMSADGTGEATGDTFKNPVTGEPHAAQIVLPEGFIWKKGECGVGSFSVKAEGLELSFTDTNWIFYEFDWADDK
ncbi:MAG TPA: DUF1326 domain-containing protein [Acidimicrobiales bacterium]|nr:DUF1326 domain-containing protein [Acidimicrobiales bacterium]